MPMPAPTDHDLMELFTDLVRRFKHRQRRDLESTADLPPMQAKALQFIACHPGQTQQDLVDHSRRDKAQVARLLKELEERGLILRQPDPKDRRVLRLNLTAAGEEIVGQFNMMRRRITTAMLDGLSTDDLQTLSRLLAAMAENLEQDLGGTNF